MIIFPMDWWFLLPQLPLAALYITPLVNSPALAASRMCRQYWQTIAICAHMHGHIATSDGTGCYGRHAVWEGEAAVCTHSWVADFSRAGAGVLGVGEVRDGRGELVSLMGGVTISWGVANSDDSDGTLSLAEGRATAGVTLSTGRQRMMQ